MDIPKHSHLNQSPPESLYSYTGHWQLNNCAVQVRPEKLAALQIARNA
jgi:hypothetical protein